MDICKKLIEFEHDLKTDMAYTCSDKELINDSYQDAYLRVHTYSQKRRKFYGTDKSVKSLLNIMCRNILLDKLRKIHRDRIEYTDQQYEFIDWRTPEDSLIEIEQSIDDPYVTKKLEDSFSKMSHVVYLTYKLRKKGMSFKDIAYMTDSTVNTSLARMRRAKIIIENEFNLIQ